MHIPFTPNHVQLVSACYPPAAALLTAGPEYSPNSQELSRLTYYAANRPGKIGKLGAELEKRVRTDCRKAAAGNTRARASLLITLAIVKAIATECRRDMAVLSPALLASVNVTLSSLSADLEIAARAATVFTAWTTYTDGLIIGVDLKVTADYMSCLKHFSRLGHFEHNDHETRNRTRLVGLAALVGVVNSEALYHSSTYFQAQVSEIMRALLVPCLQVDVSVLDHELGDIKDQPTSPILDEFRSRPTLERRAASIHIHVDGDQGPTSGDVANTALRATSSLLGHTNGNQASAVVKASIETLDECHGWEQVEHCRWLAEKAAEWTQYQYRYGIPTRLVESLAEGQDAPQPTTRHSTLAAMITTVFTSSTPLVNLSTSDIIASLISITLRRVTVSPDDSLLPPLVECISSLGTHVYYADQIQDLAGELISRLVIVETSGIPGAGKASREHARIQAVRCLLAGLLGLIHAADLHDAGKDADDDKKLSTSPTLPPPPEQRTSHEGHIRPSRRTKVTPEVWQDTLSLVCDREYAVRADYAKAIVEYIENEIPKFADKPDADGVRRPRPLADGPTQQSNTLKTLLYGDSTTRFLNALHAHLYALATSSKLGLRGGSSTSSSSPERTSPANGDDSSARGGDATSHESPVNDRRSANFPSRSRRTSLVIRMLREAPSRILPSARVAAEFSDFGNILAVMTAVHEQLPVRGLLTGIPMLIALESASRVSGSVDASTAPVLRFIKELVARTWLVLGKVWQAPAVTELAQQALSALPSAAPLPSLPDWQFGTLQPPQQPIPFPADLQITSPLSDIDSEALLNALTASQSVQEATGLGQSDLLRRLNGHEWSADGAYKDSMETKTRFDSLSGDGLSPLLKVAPALMHAENLSMQSLARSGRGVGVTDLREALEGRSSMSNPNLAAGGRVPSISTLDHTSSVFPDQQYGLSRLTPTRSRPQQQQLRAKPRPGEVREVLNKLGIGRQNGNGTSAALKSSFPAIQKTTSRNAPAFTPPYTTS